MAALGLSAIISSSAFVYSVIKYAGALYLIYLGIHALMGHNSLRTESFNSGQNLMSKFEAFKKGMLTNVLNPKAALFFFSFIPQFVKPGYTNSPAPFFLLGTMLFLMAIPWCLFLAIGASWIASFLKQNQRFQTVTNKVSGIIFIGLGIKIALQNE